MQFRSRNSVHSVGSYLRLYLLLSMALLTLTLAPNTKAAITDFSIVKTDGITSVTPSSTVNYLITITNNGIDASTAILTDPAAAGLNKIAVACGTTPGVCVTPPTIANLQAGFTTPSIPLGGTYQLRVTTTVTASSGSVANTATVTAPAGTTDTNSANNSSTDTDTLLSLATPNSTPTVCTAYHQYDIDNSNLPARAATDDLPRTLIASGGGNRNLQNLTATYAFTQNTALDGTVGPVNTTVLTSPWTGQALRPIIFNGFVGIATSTSDFKLVITLSQAVEGIGFMIGDIDQSGGSEGLTSVVFKDAAGGSVPLIPTSLPVNISDTGSSYYLGSNLTPMGANGALSTQGGNVSTGALSNYVIYQISSNQKVKTIEIEFGNSGMVFSSLWYTDCYDFGDTPANGSTGILSGATTYGETGSHRMHPNLYLGSLPDQELVHQGSVTASGDDTTGSDDENGVSNFPALNTGDESYSLNVLTTNTSGNPARVVGWIDFNRNGVFDSNEATTSSVANGTNNKITALTWASLPSTIQAGASFVRLRLTTDSSIATGTASTSQPNGTALDGEVEDYPITIENSGFSIAGKVYHDTNVNGVNNNETGLKNITLVLYDTAANTCRSTKTAADGSYHFSQVQPAAANNYIVYEAAAENLPIPSVCPPVKADPNGFVSTTPNDVAITVSAADVSGVDFGDVQNPSFTLEHSQAILPDSTVTYPHIFSTTANGTVNFSLANSADPANLAWNVILYRDTSCNSELDTADTPLTGSVAMSAGDTLCLLAKVLSPANASSGASHTLAITSQFTFGNGSLIAAPVEQTRTDLTRTNAGTTTSPIDGAGKLKLSKSVWNVTRNIDGELASPGETLRYSIIYENIGHGMLDELMVQDSVPAFTQLVSGSQQCGTLPLGLFTCTSTSNGNAIAWTLEGQVQPGAQGKLFFDVTIK